MMSEKEYTVERMRRMELCGIRKGCVGYAFPMPEDRLFKKSVGELFARNHWLSLCFSDSVSDGRNWMFTAQAGKHCIFVEGVEGISVARAYFSGKIGRRMKVLFMREMFRRNALLRLHMDVDDVEQLRAVGEGWCTWKMMKRRESFSEWMGNHLSPRYWRRYWGERGFPQEGGRRSARRS